jgi:hypothetical protein
MMRTAGRARVADAVNTGANVSRRAFLGAAGRETLNAGMNIAGAPMDIAKSVATPMMTGLGPAALGMASSIAANPATSYSAFKYLPKGWKVPAGLGFGGLSGYSIYNNLPKGLSRGPKSMPKVNTPAAPALSHAVSPRPLQRPPSGMPMAPAASAPKAMPNLPVSGPVPTAPSTPGFSNLTDMASVTPGQTLGR